MVSDPSADLRRLTNGFQVSQAIHVAAVLGIADHLKRGPRTSDDLAAVTRAHPGALYRLLRALGGVGVFEEGNDKLFSLTPMGECLRSDAPQPVGYWAAYIGSPSCWQAWGHLLHGVQTGETAFRHVHGVSAWEYRAQNSEAGATFDRAMTGTSTGVAEAVLSAYDFSPFERVVDVGGGAGTQVAALLAAHPSMRGILFDQPYIVARAQPVLTAAGVRDRCEIVEGSFFTSIPTGANAYLYKHILHDWDDEASIAILKVCRLACRPGAKLLVVERVVGAGDHTSETYFSDLNMLVMLGGQERTREEFAALFAKAGFRLERIATATPRLCVIEAVPV